jgi:hypothetical protein
LTGISNIDFPADRENTFDRPRIAMLQRSFSAGRLQRPAGAVLPSRQR